MKNWFDRNGETILTLMMIVALSLGPIMVGIVAHAIGTMALDAAIHIHTQETKHDE